MAQGKNERRNDWGLPRTRVWTEAERAGHREFLAELATEQAASDALLAEFLVATANLPSASLAWGLDQMKGAN